MRAAWDDYWWSQPAKWLVRVLDIRMPPVAPWLFWSLWVLCLAGAALIWRARWKGRGR